MICVYFLIPFLLFIFFYFIGYGITKVIKIDKYGNLIMGFIFVFGSFQIIGLPFMYFCTSFDALYFLFLLITGSIFFASIIVYFKNKEYIKAKNLILNIKKEKLLIIAILIIAFEIVLCMVLKHSDADDSYYLAQINSIISSNKIQAFDPTSGFKNIPMQSNYKNVGYEPLISIFCRLFRINAAAFCHTFLIPVLIIIHNFVFYKLFSIISDKKKNLLFLIFNLFILFGVSNNSEFLLERMWQGKASLINILIPFLFLEFYYILCDKKIEKSDIVMLVLSVYAGFNLSTVGFFIIPFLYFSLFVTVMLKNRNLKTSLYLTIPGIVSIPFAIVKIFTLGLGTSSSALASANPFTTSNMIAMSGLDRIIIYFKECFRAYYDAIYYMHSLHLIIPFIIALIIIFILGKKILKYLFGVTSIVSFLTYLNPFLYKIVTKYFTTQVVYWRLFWNLLSPVVIIYAIYLLIEYFKTNKNALIKAIPYCLVIILMSLGNFPITRDIYDKPENIEKLSQTTIDISDRIKNEKPILLAPTEISYEVRQYTGDIKLLMQRYSSYVYDKSGKAINNQTLKILYDDIYINGQLSNKSKKLLTKLKIDYIVLNKDLIVEKLVKNNIMFENDKYLLIKNF